MTMTAHPSTRSEFRQYIDENNALPDDVLFGYLVMYGVADGAYDGPAMEAAFDRLNLNKSFLPRSLNPHDAFEKASKALHGTKFDVAGGYTGEVMVRELLRDDERVVRKIIREVRDANGERLLYDEVGDLVFYKPRAIHGVVDISTARVRTSIDPNVSASERSVLEGMIAKFDGLYDQYCHFHDGQKLRAVIRKYTLHLNAIQMRPTAYFVHRNRADEVLRLQEFVDGLKTEGTSMMLVPLPDLANLREEVTEAFQRESAKEFQEVIKEITQLTESRKGPVGMAAFLKVRKQFDDALDRAGEHSRTFQVSQALTAGASEIALNALNQLQEQVVNGAMQTVSGS